MRIIYKTIISLVIALTFFIILAFVASQRIPVKDILDWWALTLPPEWQIQQVQGTIYEGQATVTIKDNTFEQSFETNWDWCPANPFTNTIIRWCVTIKTNGLEAEGNLYLTKNGQQLHLNHLNVKLNQFNLAHQQLNSIILNGTLQVKQCVINFPVVGLHRLHQLQADSSDLLVQFLGLPIDEGILNLHKEATSTLQGTFRGSSLYVKIEGHADGSYVLNAEQLDPTHYIHAITNHLFKGKKHYHYKGYWF